MNRVIRSGAERNQKGTNGQSPQRQLGESSGPTYQESPFNLCARSSHKEPGENIAPPIGRKGCKLIIRVSSGALRADETKGPDVCRQDLNHPPTAVVGIRSKQ